MMGSAVSEGATGELMMDEAADSTLSSSERAAPGTGVKVGHAVRVTTVSSPDEGLAHAQLSVPSARITMVTMGGQANSRRLGLSE